ncbi:MAG: SH3 domain-containing protein [Chloroflexota bacterium]|jgi:uncharacterized protein YraI
MNHQKCLLTVLCLICLSSLVPVIIYAQDENTIEYLVAADTANLREGPGTGYNIVGIANRGESLLIFDELQEVPGWFRVKLDNGTSAYIADFLVERAPMRYYWVDQEPIAVFSGRGRNISDVVDLPRGAYRVDATVQDNAFILTTTVVEGDCRDDVLFNELDFDTNRLIISALLMSQGCSFIFETDNVSGNWEFAIRDLLDGDALRESLLTIENGTTIPGIGRTLTMATILPEGIWTISATVDDQAFILVPQVLVGECSSSAVFNELDFEAKRLEVSTVYRSDDGGCTIFWETNNVVGSWEIKFEKIR